MWENTAGVNKIERDQLVPALWVCNMCADKNEKIGQDGRLAALRDAIRCAFPYEPYTGKITRHDDTLDDSELEEERYLYEALKGRSWTDIPQQLLDNRPDGYMRLANEAFATFLAAWLMRSLEDIDGENEVATSLFMRSVPSMTWCPIPQT